MENEPRGSLASKNAQIQIFVLKAEEMRLKEKVNEAKIYLSKALELNSDLKDQSKEAGILEMLGFCYEETGEDEKAIKTAKKAIAIFQQLPGPTGLIGHGNGLVFLGSICSKLGKYEEAIARQEEGIVILLRSGDEEFLGVAYGNMGETKNRMKEHKKAIKLCEEGLKISRKTGNKLGEARNLHNIGDAYHQMKEFKKSIKYCEESLRIFRDIGNEKGASISQGVLASSYSCLGKIHISEAYFKRCIEINQGMMQFSDLAIAHGNMGIQRYEIAFLEFLSFHDAKLSLESCIESFKLAIESTDKVLASLSEDNNKTAFSDKFYRWYNSLASPFILLGRCTAALLFLDLGRAKILRHLIYKQVHGDDNSKSSFESSWLTIEDGKEKERICILTREIQLLESDATILFYNFNDEEIFTIWILHADGCVSLKTSDPTSKTSTSRQELEGNIKKVLEKASGQFPRGYSFFKQSTVSDLKDPNAKPLTSSRPESEENAAGATSHEQKQVKVKESTDKYRAPAKRTDESCDDLTKGIRALLYRALIKPVKSLIRGTKLIIVPQSCIFFAPFSSFIDENDCLLSEQYQIQIIPSVHVLAISMQASTGKQVGSSLFVGNPELQNVLLPPLPSAEEEVKYLASLLDAKSLTGRMATKSKLMNVMSNASIIHIAAHGQEQTGHIFLAPESSKSNEGAHQTSSSDLLTQSDVLKCKLSARLVVLSCCHTGMGKLSSEGVLGIARAFLGAGANSVLVTLWSINDKFTKEFMIAFYEKVCDEKSVCLALKETMNQFQRGGQYTSYLFWAAFEILGEDVSFTRSEIEEIRRKNRDIITSN
jgi:CHAT domain-containing protein/tetratricopeptide (TPR) repeat protein